MKFSSTLEFIGWLKKSPFPMTYFVPSIYGILTSSAVYIPLSLYAFFLPGLPLLYGDIPCSFVITLSM
jgi:hypothetical protein